MSLSCYSHLLVLHILSTLSITDLSFYGIHSFNSLSKLWSSQYIKGILSPCRPGITLNTCWRRTCSSPTDSDTWFGRWPGQLGEGQAGPHWNPTKGKFLLQIPSTMENTWHRTSDGLFSSLSLINKRPAVSVTHFITDDNSKVTDSSVQVFLSILVIVHKLTLILPYIIFIHRPKYKFIYTYISFQT